MLGPLESPTFFDACLRPLKREVLDRGIAAEGTKPFIVIWSLEWLQGEDEERLGSGSLGRVDVIERSMQVGVAEQAYS